MKTDIFLNRYPHMDLHGYDRDSARMMVNDFVDEFKEKIEKAELDEKPDMSMSEDERVVKIELNDTNRPDLWSTNGVARQLRIHQGGKTADYEKLALGGITPIIVVNGARITSISPNERIVCIPISVAAYILSSESKHISKQM